MVYNTDSLVSDVPVHQKFCVSWCLSKIGFMPVENGPGVHFSRFLYYGVVLSWVKRSENVLHLFSAFDTSFSYKTCIKMFYQILHTRFGSKSRYGFRTKHCILGKIVLRYSEWFSPHSIYWFVPLNNISSDEFRSLEDRARRMSVQPSWMVRLSA